MRDYLVDGWRLGGAAIGFVLGNRPLQRFLLVAIGVVLVVSAGVAVVAVALRRHGGPLVYVLAGLGASYWLSLMVTAVAVGLAGLVAEALEGRPVTASTGWEVMRRRRGPIAKWAVVDVLVGLPSRAVGSWTVEQLGGLVLGLGWGLLSFFAIPAIALTGASPWPAARHSFHLVRRQWGDAVASTVYLWVRAAIVLGLPGAAAVAVGVLLIRADRVVLGGAFFAAGVAALALAYLLAHSARAVLTVVLYRYADSGKLYPAFPAELLDRSVRGPSRLAYAVSRRVENRHVHRLRRRVFGDGGDRPSS